MIRKVAFVHPLMTASGKHQEPSSQNCPMRITASPRSSRRTILKQSLLVICTFFPWTLATGDSANAAAETGTEGDKSVCKNCVGSGYVPCDLCSGTGFWRALSGTDPKQKYKGVVCPECEGSGTLTCPICLGTGEGNVKGLLRRRHVEPGPGRVLQTN